LVSSQAFWKVDITLSHQKKLAVASLEFFPVEPAELPEGSQSRGCHQLGEQEGTWENHTTRDKAGRGKSEVGMG
jgi:hypothetical protein